METVWRQPADALFELSTSQNARLAGAAIELDDQALIEDDAPAFGGSVTVENGEILSDGVILRKILLLDRWPVRGAEIAMLAYPVEPAGPNSGGELLFTVNGHEPIRYELRHFWTRVPVPADYLKPGENVIDVRTVAAGTKFRTIVALDQYYARGSLTRLHHPNRSLRSTDGGKSWSDSGLGVDSNVDGEYPIRLKLHGYDSTGTLESPPIDLAPAAATGPIILPARVEGARIDVEMAEGSAGGVTIHARTGPTPILNADWSDWTPLAGRELPEALLAGRFLQFRLALASQSPLESPRIAAVSVAAHAQPADAAAPGAFTPGESTNRPLIRTSFTDYTHEDMLTPELRQFRREHNLDAVVAGAATEWEQILRLRAWVASRWDWYIPKKEVPDFNAWDSRTFMKPREDGRPIGGYCLMFAVVCQQTLQSMGFPARVINANLGTWGGHELTEVWSNDHAKWVLLDANFDTHFVDRATGEPLSALELHRLLLKLYYPNETLDRDTWVRADIARRSEKYQPEDLPLAMEIGGAAKSNTLKEYEWWRYPLDLGPYCAGYGFLSMGYIRFLPRDNFMSEPLPMPLNHGRSVHWAWDGYIGWTDGQTPRTQEHRIFTGREADLYWNLNCVDYAVRYDIPGRLMIDMQTNAPNFDHYQLLVNGEARELKEGRFEFAPVAGLNRVEMRAINALGRVGPPSILEFDTSN